MPSPPLLVLPHSQFVLAPLYCKLRQSSGRAGPGGLLGAGARGHWLVIRRRRGCCLLHCGLGRLRRSGQGLWCETCVEGGSPSTSVQSASVALSTCPGPALSTPRATWWKGSFPSGVVSACFHDTVCERAADIKPGGVGMLVAGLCLALGGEPNLRKKKGWLFFAGRGAIPYVCMRSHACMRDRSSRTQRTGRGRRRGSVAPACSSAVSRSSKL